MNAKFKIVLWLIGFFLFGIAYQAYKTNLIIIAIPQRFTFDILNSSTIKKKKIRFYFLKNDDWKYEDYELLWSDDNNENAYQLVSMWLTWTEEEKFVHKKINLQSAILTNNRILYLSFERLPFSKEQSVYEKWQWIEGLLKTIREANIDLKIQSIYFLVSHQPMQDTHLEFSVPWPINGFD